MLNAANNENHEAEAYLALCYYDGCNRLLQDRSQASEYAEQAAEWMRRETSKGNPCAQFLLGNCLYYGIEGVGTARKEEGQMW